jgi:hypothetical protein
MRFVNRFLHPFLKMRIQTPTSFLPVIQAEFESDDSRNFNTTLPTGTPLNIDPQDFHSHPQSNFRIARALMEQGAADYEDGQLKLIQPYTGSLSGCAVLVKGSATNGWTFWKITEPDHPLAGCLVDEVRNS